MGFFDKIKEKISAIKEENKYMARTMQRNNNVAEYYGWVNYTVKDGDFRAMSSVNIEYGKGIIYNTSNEDYVFEANSISVAQYLKKGQQVNQKQTQLPTCRFKVAFADGKSAEMDIIQHKLLEFIIFFDCADMLEFYVKEKLITKKNFNDLFLTPVQKGKATKCEAFLLELQNNL